MRPLAIVILFVACLGMHGCGGKAYTGRYGLNLTPEEQKQLASAPNAGGIQKAMAETEIAINEDGTFTSTVVDQGGDVHKTAGRYVADGNNLTLTVSTIDGRSAEATNPRMTALELTYDPGDQTLSATRGSGSAPNYKRK